MTDKYMGLGLLLGDCDAEPPSNLQRHLQLLLLQQQLSVLT